MWKTLRELADFPDRKSLEWVWYSLKRASWRWMSGPVTIIKSTTQVSADNAINAIPPKPKRKPLTILQESTRANARSNDLQHLFADFVRRIAPENSWHDAKYALGKLKVFRDYGSISQYLRALPTSGQMSGVISSNHIASKRFSLDDRAKYLSEWMETLIKELKETL